MDGSVKLVEGEGMLDSSIYYQKQAYASLLLASPSGVDFNSDGKTRCLFSVVNYRDQNLYLETLKYDYGGDTRPIVRVDLNAVGSLLFLGSL